jgi:hypothetical protein
MNQVVYVALWQWLVKTLQESHQLTESVLSRPARLLTFFCFRDGDGYATSEGNGVLEELVPFFSCTFDILV